MKTNVIALPLPMRPPVNEGELARAQRSYLAEQAADNPPRLSTLIAALYVVDDPLEREIILRELEARK